MTAVKHYIVRDQEGNTVLEKGNVKEVSEITGYTVGTCKNYVNGLLEGECTTVNGYTVESLPVNELTEKSKNVPGDIWREWDRVCMFINSRIIKA